MPESEEYKMYYLEVVLRTDHQLIVQKIYLRSKPFRPSDRRRCVDRLVSKFESDFEHVVTALCQPSETGAVSVHVPDDLFVMEGIYY